MRFISTQEVLEPWILPTGNDLVKDPGKRYLRPDGNPGCDFPFVQNKFDDSSWEKLDLPHDWTIHVPFYEGWDAEVGGGMGRLPSQGVAWYRKKRFVIPFVFLLIYSIKFLYVVFNFQFF